MTDLRAAAPPSKRLIQLMHAAADHLFRDAQLPAWGTPATGVLVETLLDRGIGRRRPALASGHVDGLRSRRFHAAR